MAAGFSRLHLAKAGDFRGAIALPTGLYHQQPLPDGFLVLMPNLP